MDVGSKRNMNAKKQRTTKKSFFNAATPRFFQVLSGTLLLWCAQVSVFYAQAQTFHGPVSASLAGSGRAGLESGEALLLNPALLGLLATGELSLQYQDGYLDQHRHETKYGVLIADNSPDVMAPGALGYFQARSTYPGLTAVDSDLWIGGMGKLIARNAAIGFSAYRLASRPKGLERSVQWNGSFGALYLLRDNLSVAYVLSNPFGSKSSVPIPLKRVLNHGVGVFWNLHEAGRFRLDGVYQDKYNPKRQWVLAVSAESLVHPFVIARMGGRWDPLQRQQLWTGGLGFNGPRLKVDYSIEKNVKSSAGAMHSVDLRLSF